MESSKNIHVLSRAVLIDQDHLLLCKTVRDENNYYFLPGGHVEHNESAQEAVIREMHEELAMNVSVSRFIGCLEYSFITENKNKCHTHEYNFIFEILNHRLSFKNNVVSKESHIAFEWIALDKIATVDLRPDRLKQLLSRWLKLDLHDSLATKMCK